MAEIGVVIVTFNRLAKLKKTLKAYSEQTVKVKYIIVVNNASTDGTLEYLNEWKCMSDLYEKIVLNLPENIGGSGGFCEGQKLAITKEADWIMIGDDDAYPEPSYIEGMLSYIEKNGDRCSVICGKVLEDNEYKHRFILGNPYGKFLVPIKQYEYEKSEVSLEFVSYLGIVINKEKLIKAGLVRADYFIWYDDIEHCVRLKKEGDIVCLSDYTMIHDTENMPNVLSWKEYYGRRNWTDMMKRHYKSHFFVWVIFMIFKAVLCPLKGKSLIEVRLRIVGIIDGILGNMGVNDTYKPGWKA